MESQQNPQNPLPHGTSQRRRLTKKPPPAHHHHTSSLSIDGRIDAQSLGSKRSSASLRRAPSAPQARTPSSNASDSSSPRYLSTASSLVSRSHTSPKLPATSEFAATAAAATPSQSQSSQPHPLSQHLAQTTTPPVPSSHVPTHSQSQSQSRPSGPGAAIRPLSDKTSAELIGAPFDGIAILNRIDAIKAPPLVPQRPAPPPPPAPPAPLSAAPPPPTPLSHPGPDAQNMNPTPPTLPHTSSFSSTGPGASRQVVVGEKTTVPKMDNAPSSKRFSGDSGKEPKMPGVLRKKSGFSGFMTSLVGSPKKPLISAPENPVHVTHVGYDSTTGQFTVGSHLSFVPCQSQCALTCDRDCPRSGSD